MATTKEVINQVKELRGADVYYWGSTHKLPSEVNEYTIDVLSILEALEEYELPEELTKVDTKEMDWNTGEFDVVLNKLVEYGYIEDEMNYDLGNTYNWSAPISNHIDYKYWKTDNGIILSLKVHRFGDVRGNYTDHCWLKFDNDYEFFTVMSENGTKCNTVELQGKTYWCDTEVCSYGIRVSTEDGEEFYVYEYIEDDEDMLQAVKENIGWMTWLEQCKSTINKMKKGA